MPQNPNRGDGLRMKISAIPGVTRGDAKKALKTPYYFQCPPMDELQRQWAFTFSSYTNYKGEEFLQRGGKQLTPITFRTLAVEWGRFTVEENWDVDELEKSLQRVAEAGWPVQLLMTHRYGKEAEFDSPVVIETFSASENAGEQDARYFDLSCRRFSDPITNRRGEAKYPLTITLTKGGRYSGGGVEGSGNLTFADIAQQIYGKPSLAKYLMASQRPILPRYGAHSNVFDLQRYKNGGKITVPAPPGPGEPYVVGIANQPTTTE